MDDSVEQWKPVAEFEGIYEVSNLGRVRRLPSNPDKLPRILTPRDNGHGYRIVRLSRHGKPINRKVHRLVAAAFLGPVDPDVHVNHKDGVRSHNGVKNLEYTDRSGNMRHYWSMPYAKAGEKHWSSRLNEATVRQIRKVAGRMSMPALAKKYGIAIGTVFAVVHRHTWKSVS